MVPGGGDVVGLTRLSGARLRWGTRWNEPVFGCWPRGGGAFPSTTGRSSSSALRCAGAGGHRGAVQAHEQLASLLQALKGLDQVWAVVGDDVDGLMQSPVGGDQVPQVGPLDEPTSAGPEQFWFSTRRPLPQPGIDRLTVSMQTAADSASSGFRDLNSGTIGQHAEPLRAEWGILVETGPAHSFSVRPPATRSDPHRRAEHVRPPITLTRKPQCLSEVFGCVACLGRVCVGSRRGWWGWI